MLTTDLSKLSSMNSTAKHDNVSIDVLQQCCTQQKEQIIQLEQQNAELTAKVQWFEEQFRLNGLIPASVSCTAKRYVAYINNIKI